jgi:serine/threonine-protein kinase
VNTSAAAGAEAAVAGAGAVLAAGSGPAAPAAPQPRPVAPPPVKVSPAAVSPAPGPGSTVLAAEAPTRYRSGGEPATTVRPRRRRRRRTIVALILLAVVAAAAAAAAYVFVIAPGARVPSVVGEPRADAAKAVRGEGLKPVVHYVWSDRQETGSVARQSPRGGASVDEGVTVDLWVSRGPLHIPAPDLDGIAASVALQRLEADSLSGKSRRAASETAPKGRIFKQRPAAGATVARGDTVTFWVSSGPPQVFVPDVVGLSQGDATAMLEDAGFVVGTDYVAGWGEFPGDVVAQDPVAGTRGRAGDEVVIEVAVF